jgi:hypothetical protein
MAGAKTMRLNELERENRILKSENKLLQSKLDSFFTGDVPHHATFDHVILAQYGRKRLAERTRQAALLTKPTTT